MMILAALLFLPLTTGVAFDPQALAPPGRAPESETEFTPPQKDAVMRPLIRLATDCVVRAVRTNPRLAQQLNNLELGELIVDSMTPCAGPMRAMIQAHDRLFGRGSGEAFFMGPYLDFLPATVNRVVGGAIPGQTTGRGPAE